MFQEISEEHAQNIVVCLAQDLFTLHVYWDFGKLRNRVVTEFLRRIKPDYRLSIRLCRLERDTRRYVAENEVYLEQISFGNYYFHNLNPVNTYCFELGAKRPDGGFVCFYQTRPVRMQPSEEEQLASIAKAFNLDGRNDGVAAGATAAADIDADLERNKNLIAMSSWS